MGSRNKALMDELSIEVAAHDNYSWGEKTVWNRSV